MHSFLKQVKPKTTVHKSAPPLAFSTDEKLVSATTHLYSATHPWGRPFSLITFVKKDESRPVFPRPWFRDWWWRQSSIKDSETERTKLKLTEMLTSWGMLHHTDKNTTDSLFLLYLPCQWSCLYWNFSYWFGVNGFQTALLC